MPSAGRDRSPVTPGNRTLSTTSGSRCRRPSRTARGRCSPLPRLPATSARSTCSSLPLAACSSWRSRATRARRPTTGPPGSSATAARQGRSTTRCTSPTRRRRSSGPAGAGRAELNPRNPLHIPRVEAAVFLSAENLECRSMSSSASVSTAATARRSRPACRASGRLPQPAAGQREEPRHPRRLSKQLASSCTPSASPGCTRSAGSAPMSSTSSRSTPARPGRTTWRATLAAERPPRRVRVFLTEQGATEDERRSTQRAAHREYLALQGISHDGIVRAEQYSEELLAGPAVVFRHGTNWQRLDHFIARPPGDLPLDTRLEMIRQLAEALDHAHRRHLYHRALAARCVFVEHGRPLPRLRSRTGRSPPARRHEHSTRGPALRHSSSPMAPRPCSSTSSAPPALTWRRSSPAATRPPGCSTSSASARSAT